MTNRFRREVKLGIIMIGLFLFLTNCGKEPLNENLNQEEETLVSYLEVPEIEATKASFNAINDKNTSFGKSNFGKAKSLNKDSNKTFIIDWEHSIKTKFKEDQNIYILYTPVLYEHTKKMKTFIASVDNGGVIESKIMTLFYDEVANSAAFTGFISIHDTDGNAESVHKYQDGKKILISEPQDENTGSKSSSYAKTGPDDCGWGLSIEDMMWIVENGGIEALENELDCVLITLPPPVDDDPEDPWNNPDPDLPSNPIVIPPDDSGGGGSTDPVNNLDPIDNTPITIDQQWWDQTFGNMTINTSVTTLIGQVPLTEAQIIWLVYYDSNGVLSESILQFLLQQYSSEDAKKFVQLAIDAIKSDDGLEFEALIELINGLDKDCQARVLFKSILRIDSTFTNLIKDSYLKSSSRHINLQDIAVGAGEPALISSEGARTQPYRGIDPVTNGNVVIIEFNNNYLDQATDLGYVNTLYHELLHAHILHLYHDGELLTAYPTYTALNTALNNYFSDNNNLSFAEVKKQEMHNIYVDFIDDIAGSLVAYAQENGISGIGLDYAKKLVWGGLNGYDVFTNNLTVAEQNEAQTLLAKENFNHSDAKSNKTCN